MIHAFVLMNVEPDHIATAAVRAADFDGVRSAHSVAGSEADVVVVLAVPSHDEIARVVTEDLATLEGLVSTRTMIAFRSYTSDEMDAAYEGFGD